MRAMILAAGLGERLRPHTLKCAKPALPFLNLPLICYPWYHLQKVGASEGIVNTHHCADSIKHAVQLFGLSHVQFIHESPLILGSGGGIKNARDDLAGDRHFLVANGDEVLLDPSGVDELWRRHTSEDNLATLLVCQFPGVGTKFGGVWCDPTERVINFGKTPDSEGLVGFHYTGFIALSDRVFDYLPAGQISNILYDGLASGMAKGEVVKVHRAEPYWFETGSEADYLSASQNCLKHLIDGDPQGVFLKELHHHYGRVLFPHGPEMFVGPDCQLDSNISVGGPCLLGQGVSIKPNTILKGFNVIGDGTHIGENCVLENSVIGRGLSIVKNTRINSSLRLT